MDEKLTCEIYLTRFDNYGVYELEESTNVDKAIAILVSKLVSLVNCKCDNEMEPTEKKKKLKSLKSKITTSVKDLEKLKATLESYINEEIVNIYKNYISKYMNNITEETNSSNDLGFKYILQPIRTKSLTFVVKHNKGGVNSIHDLNSFLTYINGKIRNSHFQTEVKKRK